MSIQNGWCVSYAHLLFLNDQIATLSQPCSNPSRTCTGNTACGSSGRCVCASDYVQYGATCVYNFGSCL